MNIFDKVLFEEIWYLLRENYFRSVCDSLFCLPFSRGLQTPLRLPITYTRLRGYTNSNLHGITVLTVLSGSSRTFYNTVRQIVLPTIHTAPSQLPFLLCNTLIDNVLFHLIMLG